MEDRDECALMPRRARDARLRVFRCGWLRSWGGRPEGPVPRRQRDHQLRLLAAGGGARHRAARAQPGGDLGSAAAGGGAVLHGDIRDPSSVRDALGDREFDAVVDWVAFTPEHVRADLDLFRGRTGQYVFISSASAYQTPPARLPVIESTPLRNPFWQYSRDKIACEDLLVARVPGGGLPGHDRAALAHLRPDARAVRRRLDRAGAGCARARRSSSTATAPRCGR